MVIMVIDSFILKILPYSPLVSRNVDIKFFFSEMHLIMLSCLFYRLFASYLHFSVSISVLYRKQRHF